MILTKDELEKILQETDSFLEVKQRLGYDGKLKSSFVQKVMFVVFLEVVVYLAFYDIFSFKLLFELLLIVTLILTFSISEAKKGLNTNNGFLQELSKLGYVSYVYSNVLKKDDEYGAHICWKNCVFSDELKIKRKIR